MVDEFVFGHVNDQISTDNSESEPVLEVGGFE